MIDVIDYGGGNTGSLRRALRRLGAPHRLAGTPADIEAGNPLVLPGVGSFAGVLEGLGRRGLDGPLRRALAEGRPYLGVCVGLQALFEGSEESPGVEGLRALPGAVVRLGARKVPQIGWNRVVPAPGSGYPEGFAYFVNSYVARPRDPSVVLYESDYEGAYCAAVRRGNLTAFQFHPEKSGAFGHGLLRRWIEEFG